MLRLHTGTLGCRCIFNMDRSLPAQTSAEPPSPPQLARPVKGGNETILVVEKDAAVLSALVNSLQALGYRALRARDARAALSVLDCGLHVDLLFTDLALPGSLRSTELARRARQLIPGIAVLFTGGSAPDTAIGRGDLQPGEEFLRWPCRQEDLAQTIRHLLANQQQVNALASVLSESRAAARATGATADGMRVLLVEDQPEVRDTSQQLLELLGCEVEGVPSAEAAEAALRTSRFNVVLTDISLPGRSGVELARDAGTLQPGIKVVLSSGWGQTASHDLALKGLTTWNLPKPYGLYELESLLNRLKAG